MTLEPEQPRYVNLSGATGQIRVATFQARDHLVVPVVALVEGVLHPANVTKPEFCPAHVIAAAPQGWNGRPVVIGHPQVNNEFVSANSPEILEKASIGLVFNSQFRDDRLHLEAWIDKEKAAQAGPEAATLIEKLEANQMIEVSVGAHVSTENRIGVHKGKQYFCTWRSMIPDHLALLRDGDKGACSNGDGCGAPRVAMHLVTAQGIEVVGEPMAEAAEITVSEQPKKSIRERILDILIGEEPPVAEVKPLSQSHGCGCGGDKVMEKAQRIKTLIDSGRFLEADRTWLEQVPDERLSVLEAAPKAEEAKAEEKKTETVVVAAAASPVTAEQYISQAPKEIQESLREGLRVQQERRTEIVSALKSTGRCDFNDEQLGSMTTDYLQRLLKLAEVPPPPNFVGRLNTRTKKEEGVPPPPSLADSIKAARQRQ